jgi:hypothetical protein
MLVQCSPGYTHPMEMVETVLRAIAFLLVFYLVASYWEITDPEALKRTRRALRRARRVSIAEAPEGEVIRIDGRVAKGETVEAPLSGRLCVYYSITVDEPDGDHPFPRARETGGVAFTIDDGTGRAIVDPEGARIIECGSTRSGTIEEPTAREAAFLERHGISLVYERDDRKRLIKPLWYREHVSEIGDSIAVMCQPRREPDRDAASRSTVYREPPPPDLYVSGSSARPILLSTRDIAYR